MNVYNKKSMERAPVTEKLKNNILEWYGDV